MYTYVPGHIQKERQREEEEEEKEEEEEEERCHFKLEKNLQKSPCLMEKPPVVRDIQRL